MGDRGNIIVEGTGPSPLYFYTHWAGSSLPAIVARGLKRGRDQWDDAPYLARVLFCELMLGEELSVLMDTRGYGISTEIGDGGKDITVDVDMKTVDGVPFEEWIARHS